MFMEQEDRVITAFLGLCESVNKIAEVMQEKSPEAQIQEEIKALKQQQNEFVATLGEDIESTLNDERLDLRSKMTNLRNLAKGMKKFNGE